MNTQNPDSQSLDPDLAGKDGANRSSAGSESLYRQLFELMPGSIVLMDARGYIVDANPAFCRQIGYPRETLIGTHVSRFSQDSIEAIEKNIARIMAGEVLEHQVSNQQADGSERHYELREAVINLPDGSRGILALATDVTDRQEAERQKLEFERQLLHADKLKSLGVLAGDIAHEYNNFLAAIVGNLDLAMMDLPASSPVQTNLREAAHASLRARNLTEQMLIYSGRAQSVTTQIDLSELVGEIEELLRASISKKASVKFELASDLPYLEGDDPQIQQVIMNLLTNASEALGDRPGVIQISTRWKRYIDSDFQTALLKPHPTEGIFVELEIHDSGRGMNRETLAHLFDPFFSTKQTGRGLGMSVVMGVVRGHGGTILVSSSPNRGTSVRVLFPAKSPRLLPRAYSPPAAAPPTAPEELAFVPLRGTVLVAEDEVMIRLLIERILRRHGLHVLTAENGHEAVGLFRAHAAEITFVIIDYNMPKLDGFKTFAAIRAIRKDVPGVLTSGYDVTRIGQRYLQEGFTAFVRKPFQVETLMEVSAKLCPRG